ncbi:MAG: GWxTD domain-containing protein, partial [Candidatus Marinimicrobia bacterium]|nr:GWxTD domain-containing protein [Candidatus Neomarinimicrobiota bacterium]
DLNSPGSYKTRYTVTDLNQKEIIKSDWKSKPKPGDSSVEINGLNIASIESGLYNLNFECMDEQSEQMTTYKKRFYMVKEEKRELLSSAFDEEMLKGLSEKELDDKFGPMKFVAAETEIKMYRKSDMAGKRQIIARFWDRRDNSPQTPINEARQEFEDRLNYSNEQFRTARQPGWKTDMGRIYIIYGPPSEVERYPSSLEKKPYQIWSYNDVEGGIIFVFVDKTGFGSMELVHSTARNELSDTNWERWITPSATGDNTSY